MHVQQSIAVIKAKGLQEDYKKVVQTKKECMEELKKAVPNPNLIEREVMDDSNLSKAVKTATQAQAKTKSVVEHIANQIFQLYANFLSEKARQLWKKS
jgi:uncharacterized membrane protein